MLYNRVFIFVLDGAGAFMKDAEAPVIKSFLKDHYLTYEAKTVFPPISAECYGSLLHGVVPEKHGRTNDNTGKEVYPEGLYPSIFQLARKKYPDAKLASFTCWMNIGYGIIEMTSGHNKVSVPDDELALLAADYLTRNDPKLMLTVFDDTDHAGHADGYGTQAHLEQITKTDRNVGVVLEQIEKNGWLDDSLFLFCADHGGGGRIPTGHGADHPMDMTIFWGARGADVAEGSAPVDIRDTASVAAEALGIEVPDYFEGKIPEGLFQK